jgi:exodeoxyribonuclease V beta subunit
MMTEQNKSNGIIELNDIRDIHLDRHGIIQASAGTGKTYTIEKMVLKILDDSFKEPQKFNNKPVILEDFLIVTYTDKAAGELRKRIRTALEDCIKESISNQADCTHFENALSQVETANINTIHGFCKQIISTYAFENNVNLDQELCDDKDGMRQLIRNQIRERWCKDKIPKIKDFIERTQALDSGKPIDEFIVGAADYLGNPNAKPMPEFDSLEKLVEDEKELAIHILCFLRKFLPIWKELKGLIPASAKGPFATAEKISIYCDELKRDPLRNSFYTSRQATRLNFLESLFTQGGTGRVDGFVEKLEAARPSFSEIQKYVEERQEQQDKIAIRFIWTEAEILAQSWKQKKDTEGIISFNDMIRIVADALENEKSSLRDTLQQKFRYGIIDEFQDTSPYQWSIFKNIFLTESLSSPAPRYLYLVGDPKQSIYSFQGADVNTYLRACEEMKDPKHNAVQYELRKNFRSTEQLIRACNSIFRPKNDSWFSPGKSEEEAQIRYTEVDAGRTGESSLYTPNPEFAEAGEKHINAPVIAFRSTQENKGLQLQEYADWCHGKISELIKNKTSPVMVKTDQGVTPLHYGHIAFLFRNRKDALYLMTKLKEEQVPYSFYKEEGVFQSEECLHILTLLKAIDDPGHLDRNIISALITFFFNWSTKEIESADRMNDSRGHFNLFDEWSALAEEKKWGPLINSIRRKTRIDTMLPLMEGGDRKFANLRQIMDWFLEYSASHSGGLTDHTLMLESLFNGEAKAPEDQSYFAKETQSDRVQIMTMHASKGLEFPVVFSVPSPLKHNHLNGLYQKCNETSDGQIKQQIWVNHKLPDAAKVPIQCDNIEETMRLSYVACTRAGFRLYLPTYGNVNQDLNFIKKNLDDNDVPGLLGSDAWEPPLWEPQNFGQQSEKSTITMTDLERYRKQVKEELKNCRIEKVNLKKQLQSSYSNLIKDESSLENIDGRLSKSNEGENLTPDSTIQNKGSSPIYEYPTLTGGASMGDVLHEVLENMTFREGIQTPEIINAVIESGIANDLINHVQPQTLSLIETRLKSHGFGNEDLLRKRTSEMLQMVCRTLSTCVSFTDIQGRNPVKISLGDLKSEDYKAEAEFYFNFDRKGIPFPELASDIAGFVKGFVDMTFRVPIKGNSYRYHVLDWKSTTLNSYDYNSMQEAMVHHQYDKQAMLYTLALHEWLKVSVTDYDPNLHLGLPCYVYNRGVNMENEDGFWRPDNIKEWTPDVLLNKVKQLIQGNKKISQILDSSEEAKS